MKKFELRPNVLLKKEYVLLSYSTYPRRELCRAELTEEEANKYNGILSMYHRWELADQAKAWERI